MEPKFQTSFIPKKPINIGTDSMLPPIRSTGIFSVSATIIFILTLLAGGGLYAYKIILNRQITAADASLVASRASFEPEVIHNLINMSSRLMSAKHLLEKHVVTSELFSVLQSLTVKKVRFSNFTYTTKNNIPAISMDGEAQSYNALAYQATAFAENSFIKDSSFSDFGLSENGTVTVKFQAMIDPSLISYKRVVEILHAESEINFPGGGALDQQTNI